MRKSIRFNKEEEAQVDLLGAMTGLDDFGTILKFAVDYAIYHYNLVSSSLISPKWEVIIQRKSKTTPAKKVFYFEK